MDRAIITVVGKDTVGIIAAVCTYLAKNNINILDISQTIVDELTALGADEIGVQIKCQKEEIFDSMHRI